MATEFDFSTLTEAQDIEWVAPPEETPGTTRYVGPQELDSDAVDEEPDRPDLDITKEKKQSRRAKAYTDQVGLMLGGFAKEALEHPNTVADGAALLYYTDKVAVAWGELADADERVRKGLDWIAGGVENPYLAAVMATLPLALQIVRNHEPEVETTGRVFKVFGKEFKFKFRIKMGRLRQLFTHDPDELVNAALTPANVRTLEKNGVRVAKRTRRNRS